VIVPNSLLNHLAHSEAGRTATAPVVRTHAMTNPICSRASAQSPSEEQSCKHHPEIYPWT
jgi:hypothetical protein